MIYKKLLHILYPFSVINLTVPSVMFVTEESGIANVCFMLVSVEETQRSVEINYSTSSGRAEGG